MDDQSIIEKVLLETVKEQRCARRWRIFFRFIYLVIIIFGIYIFNQDRLGIDNYEKQVAVVDLTGIIDGDNQTYQTISDGLKAALENKNTVAVIIRANSPGGSPVYSNMLYDEILRLRKQYPKKPIDIVMEEMCASGCYYIASAATDIYANPSSIVGSIGVIYTGFGATELIKKLGIDSRLLISGKNKAMGYPFVPANKEQEQMQQQMLDQIHNQFIAAVEKGRGKRLKLDTPDLFSGRYWIGEDALKIGLIDGYASVDSLAKDKYKTDNVVDYSEKTDSLDKLAKRLGLQAATYIEHGLNLDGFNSFR